MKLRLDNRRRKRSAHVQLCPVGPEPRWWQLWPDHRGSGLSVALRDITSADNRRDRAFSELARPQTNLFIGRLRRVGQNGFNAAFERWTGWSCMKSTGQVAGPFPAMHGEGSDHGGHAFPCRTKSGFKPVRLMFLIQDAQKVSTTGSLWTSRPLMVCGWRKLEGFLAVRWIYEQPPAAENACAMCQHKRALAAPRQETAVEVLQDGFVLYDAE